MDDAYQGGRAALSSDADPMPGPQTDRSEIVAECIVEDDRWTDMGLESLVETACAAALGHFDLARAPWEISVLGCDDARIAALNADFRGKPRATNVLSWPSEERAAEQAGHRPKAPDFHAGLELGDIAIAYDTCAREADEAGKPLADHVTHLLVHATLHLLGYDHENDDDATLMESLETEILASLGLEDPYSH